MDEAKADIVRRGLWMTLNDIGETRSPSHPQSGRRSPFWAGAVSGTGQRWLEVCFGNRAVIWEPVPGRIRHKDGPARSGS